jgi:hypothetical protein
VLDTSANPGAALYGVPVVEDGFLYLFGGSTAPFGGQLGSHVARAPLTSLEDRAAWQFWTGSSWSSNVGDARDIPGMRGGGRVFYNTYLDRWVTVSDGWFWQGVNNVFIQTATSLTGPWTGPADPIYDHASQKCPGAPSDQANTYGGLADPAYSMEGDRVLGFTYARPNYGSCPGQVRWVTARLQ